MKSPMLSSFIRALPSRQIVQRGITLTILDTTPASSDALTGVISLQSQRVSEYPRFTSNVNSAACKWLQQALKQQNQFVIYA
jgi:hypothetical protein